MITTLSTEQSYLEQILSSRVIGFCFLDADNKLVQVFSSDPDLKEALVEYQTQRVSELELSLSTNSVLQ
jgi:hypothetical protein